MANKISEVTCASFKTDVLGSSTPVLVDFFADWCGPCKALSPKLEELASGGAHIVKLDIDSAQDVATEFGVRGIPTMILFQNGKEIDRLVGNQPKDAIVSMLSKHK